MIIYPLMVTPSHTWWTLCWQGASPTAFAADHMLETPLKPPGSCYLVTAVSLSLIWATVAPRGLEVPTMPWILDSIAPSFTCHAPSSRDCHEALGFTTMQGLRVTLTAGLPMYSDLHHCKHPRCTFWSCFAAAAHAAMTNEHTQFAQCHDRALALHCDTTRTS